MIDPQEEQPHLILRPSNRITPFILRGTPTRTVPGRQEGGVSRGLFVDPAGRLLDGHAGMAPELPHPRPPSKLEGKRSGLGTTR